MQPDAMVSRIEVEFILREIEGWISTLREVGHARRNIESLIKPVDMKERSVYDTKVQSN